MKVIELEQIRPMVVKILNSDGKENVKGFELKH